MPVRSILRARRTHDPFSLQSISAQQALAIDTKQFAQGVRVAPVGFGGRSNQRLDHQHQVSAVILPQPFHEPIVKSADFHDGHELLASGSRLRL
jgi:hypothetical protein